MKLLSRFLKPKRHERINIRVLAAVEYETFVLNPDGSVASHRKPKRNLILDQGLNMVATTQWVDCFEYCVVGTGNNPTKRPSGATTFTRAGNVVTASGNFFVAADVGRLLKFDSGEEMYVTVFTDAQHVNVNIAGAIAASPGTMWYVNDTGLQTESARTNTKATAAGDNGTTFAVDTYTNKRTFIFPPVGAPVTYREIGWSNNPAAGANLFGRDIIPGVGDSLLTGQQYKVIVRLLLTLAPVTIQAAGDVGNNGFVTTGTYNHQFIGNAYSKVNPANGARVSGCIEPSLNPCACAMPAGMVLNAAVSDTVDVATPNLGVADFVNAAYTAGSFFIDSSGTFDINTGNGNVAGFFFGVAGGGIFKNFGHLFNAVQTKDNVHRLTVTLRKSWGRILVN